MNREDTIVALSILKSAYPRFYQGMSRDDAEAVINLWSFMFSDYPVEGIKDVLYKIISISNYPPSVSEVKKAFINMKNGSINFISSANTDWEVVLKAIRDYGYTRPDEALSCMNDITKKTIKNMGGWKNICLSNNTSYDKSSFIKIYEQIENENYSKMLIDNSATYENYSKMAIDNSSESDSKISIDNNSVNKNDALINNKKHIDY